MVRLGQNFLADPNLLDAIVRDAELGPEDVVLEVGAGEGVLSERLAAAAKVPEDRILVETDAPYLAPQPLRGKRNQPAFVVETAQAIAAERGTSYEDLERTVEANARALFGW